MIEANPYQAPTVVSETLSVAAQKRELPDAMIEALQQTRPWVTFLAILGFIGCGLMALMSVVLLAAGSLLKQGKQDFPAWIGLVYLPLALIYVPPSVFLLRYGRTLSAFLATGSLDSLTDAMRHQKSFWRFLGILTIIILMTYVLALVGVIGVAVISAARH